MVERKQNGSMVCPKCRKLISVNSEKCFFCGYRKPGFWGFGPSLQQYFGTNFGILKMLIFFCGGLFILSLMMEPSAISFELSIFNLLSPGGRSLYSLGCTGSIPVSHGRWWTLLTAVFLHGSLLHIVFNFLWINKLWPIVEELFGQARVVIIYIFAGIIGYVFSVYGSVILSGIFSFIRPTYYTLGASGSLFGLFGAIIYYGRDRGGVVGNELLRQLGVWVIIGFVYGLMVPHIDNLAHLGGFVGGYLGAMIMSYTEKHGETIWHNVLAIGLMVATVFAFILNLFLMSSSI